MANYFSPLGNGFAFVDSNGNPLSGALLFTYVAGSSTKRTTYKNEAGSSSHTNPIVLDSNGRVPDPLWLIGGTSYKFVLAPSNDTDPPASAIETWDDIDGVNDTSVSIDQWISGPTPTYVSATQLTLVGDQTSTFHVGRRVKTTDSGGTDYSTIIASAYTTLTTLTLETDSSGSLDSGLSAISYALLSSNNDSVPRPSTYKLLSTDAGASAGPAFTLDRNSASPAASDVLGAVTYRGRDSAGNAETYAQTQAEIVDATSTSEDGKWAIQTVVAGTLATRAYVAQGVVVGSPTGTDKGAGTINVASGLYDNNNRAYSATSMYESAETAISKGAALQVNHGLAARPKLMQVVFRCTTTDVNFAVGDEVEASTISDNAGNNVLAQYMTSSAIGVVINNTTLYVRDPTSGTATAMTDANWRVVFRGWL